jgi:hypothetical protein
MNIIPYRDMNHCPTCGATAFFRRSCSDTCLRGGVQNFLEATEHGSEPRVHLHVQCQTCSFTWLEDTQDPTTVKEVW